MIYGENIQHPCHQGHLLQLELSGKPYICNGCNEIGFGRRYTCGEEACRFHLHKDCGDADDALEHPFFKRHAFKLRVVSSAGGERMIRCVACGRGIKGWHYHCDGAGVGKKQNGMDVHSSCAFLPRTIGAGDMTLELKRRITARCHECKGWRVNGVSTWAYVSECWQYHFHVGCVEKKLVDAWERGAYGDRIPELQIDERNTAGDKTAKMRSALQVAVAIIFAVVFGDPAAMVVNLVSAVISRVLVILGWSAT